LEPLRAAVHKDDSADRPGLRVRPAVENTDDFDHLGPPAGGASADRDAGRSADHPKEGVHDCRLALDRDFRSGEGRGCLKAKGVAAVCRDEPERRLRAGLPLERRAGRDAVVLEPADVARACQAKGFGLPGARVVRAGRPEERVLEPKAVAFGARQALGASRPQAARRAAREERGLAQVST
jgi:hypothetical protein